VTEGRRRRLATIAVAVAALGIVGPFLLNAIATAAAASTRSSLPTSTTAKTVVNAPRRRKAVKTVRRPRKRGLPNAGRIARSTTTISTTTTSTTSTTFAHKPSPLNTHRLALGRVGGAGVTQPVSARHSGVSPLTVMLLLMGVLPLTILGFGLVGADLGSTRSRRRRKSVGIPPQP
jgi:hypothetical protein